ncbi:MAG: lactonase family protein [Clostridiales bacterium]|mgnify:CR=1 FL=1|nr:lactonase family protein [Clostridiales bacterium]
MKFYIGTLTSEGGEGILICAIERDRLVKNGVITGLTDPKWLVLTKDSRRLFSVSSDQKGEPFSGSVSEYDVSGEEPVLKARYSSGGETPCYLSTDEEEHWLYLANYNTASVCAFPIDGILQDKTACIINNGSGPHPARQTSAHLHQILPIPNAMDVASCDLGTDELLILGTDRLKGLTEIIGRTHLHGGPRHVLFGQRNICWLVHELSNEVTVLHRNGRSFQPLQTLSTLPKGYSGNNTAAAIRFDPSANRLYVSNRGHGSLAEYSVAEDGLLELIRWIPCGEYPRDFRILPENRIIVADQYTGVHLLDLNGKELDFMEAKGAVCVTLNQAT